MSGGSVRATQSAWRIFRWPLLIAVGSAVGLIAALVGDGGYDVLSWLLLGGAVLVMAGAWRRGRRSSRTERGVKPPRT